MRSSNRFLFFILTFLPMVTHAQNALNQIATSLQPGTWKELVTTNINALSQPGTDGNIITYGADVAWDPNTQKLLYIGNDHIDSVVTQADRFVIYDANTNSWQNMAPPPWSVPGVTDHGYYHHAFDAATGLMYRRAGKSATKFGVYKVTTNTWTYTPDDTSLPGLVADYACCSGVDFFPELGGLVQVQGSDLGGAVIRLMNSATGVWSGIGQRIASLTSTTFTYGAYNSVYKIMIFGQNGGSYKLTQNKTIEQIASPPFSLYNGSASAIISADPASGEYLVITPTRQFYSYNVPANTWKVQTSIAMPDFNGSSVVSTPIPNYGVTMYVSCRISTCHTYIYKHAPSGALPPADTTPPVKPKNVQVR